MGQIVAALCGVLSTPRVSPQLPTMAHEDLHHVANAALANPAADQWLPALFHPLQESTAEFWYG